MSNFIQNVKRAAAAAAPAAARLVQKVLGPKKGPHRMPKPLLSVWEQANLRVCVGDRTHSGGPAAGTVNLARGTKEAGRAIAQHVFDNRATLRLVKVECSASSGSVAYRWAPAIEVLCPLVPGLEPDMLALGDQVKCPGSLGKFFARLVAEATVADGCTFLSGQYKVKSPFALVPPPKHATAPSTTWTAWSSKGLPTFADIFVAAPPAPTPAPSSSSSSSSPTAQLDDSADPHPHQQPTSSPSSTILAAATLATTPSSSPSAGAPDDRPTTAHQQQRPASCSSSSSSPASPASPIHSTPSSPAARVLTAALAAATTVATAVATAAANTLQINAPVPRRPRPDSGLLPLALASDATLPGASTMALHEALTEDPAPYQPPVNTLKRPSSVALSGVADDSGAATAGQPDAAVEPAGKKVKVRHDSLALKALKETSGSTAAGGQGAGAGAGGGGAGAGL